MKILDKHTSYVNSSSLINPKMIRNLISTQLKILSLSIKLQKFC